MLRNVARVCNLCPSREQHGTVRSRDLPDLHEFGKLRKPWPKPDLIQRGAMLTGFKPVLRWACATLCRSYPFLAKEMPSGWIITSRCL